MKAEREESDKKFREEREVTREASEKRIADERDANDKRFAEALAVVRILAMAEFEKLRSESIKNFQDEREFVLSKYEENKSAISNLNVDLGQKLDQINEDKDMQEYKTARENSEKINKEIESNNVELKEVVEKKNDIKKIIDDQNKDVISKKEKIRNFEFDKKTKLSEVEKNNKEIKLLERNESGQVCKNCYSKIDPENYKSVIEKYKDLIDSS